MARKPKEKAKIYFPGLHGLRFFAALMVVLSHVELVKDYHGYPNLYAPTLRFTKAGEWGSHALLRAKRFLISYLLLTEKKVAGTVAVRKFYLRRILRIWPLYYLLVSTAAYYGFEKRFLRLQSAYAVIES